MYCFRCGEKLSERANLCHICGTPVSTATGLVVNHHPSQNQPIVVEKIVSSGGVFEALGFVFLLGILAVGAIIGFHLYQRHLENQRVAGIDINKDGSIKVKLPDFRNSDNAPKNVTPNLQPEPKMPLLSQQSQPQQAYTNSLSSCSVVGSNKVNVRVNCDFMDCDSDPDTIATIVENGTLVDKVDGFGVLSTYGYSWEKVQINNKNYFIASTKLVCSHGE